MIEIKTKVTIVGGRHVTNRNYHLFRLEKLKPGCCVVGHPQIPDPKSHREVYRIKKDHWDEWKDGKQTGHKRKGYSFVEVTHGGGMCGIQPSVRKLVMAATFGIFGQRDDYQLFFEGEDAQQERRAA